MTGKKKTGRTKQLSLKATPKFHQQLKDLASEEKCLMIEILERSLELYENHRVKENAVPQVPPTRKGKRQFEDEEIEQPNPNLKKRKISE